MANRYFEMAQILATITGFMFLMWSITYSSALSSLSESNTAMRHSMDITLNLPQQLLTFKNLLISSNDTNSTNLINSYLATYTQFFTTSIKTEADDAKYYAELSTNNMTVSNNALIFSCYFLGVSILFAIAGFIKDTSDKKRKLE